MCLVCAAAKAGKMGYEVVDVDCIGLHLHRMQLSDISMVSNVAFISIKCYERRWG